MNRLIERRSVVKCVQLFCAVLIGLVVLSLSVALVLRGSLPVPSKSATMQSNSTPGMHQPMDQDALQWTPTLTDFSVLEAATFYPRLAPAGPPIPGAVFHETLYNRPPPSC